MRLLAALAAAALACAQTPTPGEWPQFRGNPQLTGVSASTLPAKPRLVWTWDAGEAIESSAAISGGMVYVASMAGELAALELATGKVKWRYKTGAEVGESSPAVAGGIVYVGDLGGVIHAVDADGGKPLWTFKTAGEVKSSPVIAEGRLLIGSYDSHLYALDARTGKLIWKFQTTAQVHSTPGVAGGITFITGCDEIFHAIRVSDGREDYQIPSRAYTGASPALTPAMAFFGTFDNQVLGVSLAQRKVAWRYEHPRRKFPFYSSPAVFANRVYVGGRDKMMHALDARTGRELWTFMTRSRVDSSPVYVRGAGGQRDRVFFGSNDGRLYALDALTGVKVWDYEAGAGLSASPAAAAGMLVIGGQDGKLYAFGE
ncbi:MAG: PQQ-binding-like beta-propeller repeat protein [Bryobacterales bacterium]|nr:PQQ-binding-like beta-propeller repeat protein [Bryobacterales bacterium]